MEVDHPAATHPASEDKKDNRTSDVQVEIEQRWHQVERTPLREEKQVPINTASGNSERLPPNELAALLDKEVRSLSAVICVSVVLEHLVPFVHYFFLCSVGTEAAGAGPTTEAKQCFKRAVGRCTGERTNCQRGLCAAGTTLIIHRAGLVWVYIYK